MCEHRNIKTIGEAEIYEIGFPLLIRKCKDCGAIHLGSGWHSKIA